VRRAREHASGNNRSDCLRRRFRRVIARALGVGAVGIVANRASGDRASFRRRRRARRARRSLARRDRGRGVRGDALRHVGHVVGRGAASCGDDGRRVRADGTDDVDRVGGYEYDDGVFFRLCFDVPVILKSQPRRKTAPARGDDGCRHGWS